jgi:hypothetical protein
MTTTYDLLSRGYFPKELPPTFYTEDFASKVVGYVGVVPNHFLREETKARACMHNFARVGTLRRRLAITNPVTQYNLARVIDKHWARIEQLVMKSPFSQSRPVISPERAVVASGSTSPTLRARLRASSRFLLTSDISRFYHSIYTHSVPWAVHTKRFAKRNRRGYHLLGNALDLWLRNGQDGQTMGIPIGPDTSLIVAELVLAAVDRSFVKELPKVRGSRFMDDYELVFSSRQNAERALGVLQETMSEFELALNPDKTRIEELPCVLEQPWLVELRDFDIGNKSKRQASELLAFFDRAYSLARHYPGKNVLAYAIARLSSVRIHQGNWQLYQDLLFQAILAEPGTFIAVLAQLVTYKDKRYSIDTVSLGDVVNIQILHQAPLGHASEVAWALWAVLSFNLKVVTRAARALSSMHDSVVALLALDARSRGLIASGLRTDIWAGYLTKEDLFGEQWLLSYEAAVKGWLRAPNGVDHIAQVDAFAWLRDMDVEFYNVQNITTPTSQTTGSGAVPSSLTAALSGVVARYMDRTQPDGGDDEADADDEGESGDDGGEQFSLASTPPAVLDF